MLFSSRTKNIVLFSIFVLSSCTSLKPALNNTTSENRAMLFRRGNLLSNNSFELHKNKVPLNWHGNGCSISQNTAHSGKASLGLSSKGDSISTCTSAAVNVISGHYNISLWLRVDDNFKDAENTLLSEKLMIKLKRFNKDGKLLSAELVGKSKIDPDNLSYSFKGLSVKQAANFKRFTKLSLVPRFYPFDSGWLSEEVDSIALEFNYKGKRSIYIDDIDFSFSKWNFPLKERLNLIASDASSAMPELLPAPQSIGISKQPLFIDYQDKNFFCVKKASLHPTQEIALKWLEGKLEFLGISTPLERSACKNGRIALFLGRKNIPAHLKHLTKKLKSDEHYLIQNFDIDSKQKGIIIAGGGPRGDFYAMQSFLQLIDADSKGNPLLWPARIYDFPAYKVRAVSAKDSRRRLFRHAVEASGWLAESRINTLFLEDDESNQAWWEPSAKLLDAFRKINLEAKHYGLVDAGAMLNPYIHNANAGLKKDLVLSDKATLAELLKVVDLLLKDGTKHLMLRADDWVPSKEGFHFKYYLKNEADINKFKSLAQAHAYLIKQVKRFVQQNFPGTKLYFCPPWYNNDFVDYSSGFGVAYLYELSRLIASDIPILWSGSSVRSLFIDEAHIERFKGWLNGREAMLWDNTLYARRHNDFWKKSSERMELNSFFEPYDVMWPGERLAAGLYNPAIFINGDITELFRIQLATVGAYLWNPEAYEPEKVLGRYLIQRFGKFNSGLLIEFDALFWKLKALKKAGAKKHKTQIKEVKNELFKLQKELDQELSFFAGDLVDELNERLLRENILPANENSQFE